jgi:two-component system cell cycle sensor histidine kinase/response regulator CckA
MKEVPIQSDNIVGQSTESPPFIRYSPYRSLVEHMQNGYAYCRMIVEAGIPVDFIYESVNPAFSELTGLKNVIGRKISELIPDIMDTNPEFIERLGRVAESGMYDQFELDIRSLNKLHTVTAYSPKQGYVVVLFDDLPERKRVEEQLKKSEEQFRQLFESHSAIQLLIDPDTGRIMHANHAAADFYGWSVEELRDMMIQQINTLDADVIRHNMQNTIANKQIIFSFRHRRANRSIRDVEVFCSKIRINGKFLINSIIHDVTERKRFEALSAFRLKQLKIIESCSADELLKATLDEAEMVTGSSIGLFHIMADDQESFLPQIWSTNTLQKMCLKDVVNSHTALFETGIWAETVRTKKPLIQNDYSVVLHPVSFHSGMPEGHANVKRIMVVPVIRGNTVRAILGLGSKSQDYDDDDARWVSSLADVAWDLVANKRAEEDREKLQNKLQHSQKMEMLGQLAGGIAHDFNNMLAVILGYTEIAIEKGEFSLNDLQDIHKAATYSADLTRQLLAFARKQVMKPTILDLNTMVEGMLPMLRRLIGEHISLLWLPERGPSRVKIDPSHVDQILANLCVNSRDAIEGTGTITIETSLIHVDITKTSAAHPCFLPGDYVMLTVSDSGCGIEKKYLANIFEPFFTTKEIGKGTGLGLSMVYGIVKQNNGYIECKSIPGKGTTFIIYFPQHHGEAARIERKPAEPLRIHDKTTILLVEDQVDILYVFRHMLEEKGYTVLEAATPSAAIEIAAQYEGAIDLLLTDVIMPEMNGSDLSKKIQLILPNLKTLFMSGYTVDVINPHVNIDDGINFIEKPFTGKKLIKAVQETLRTHNSFPRWK